ncbi:MAG: zinc ribbon domain-containing protein [Planctomycetota bacterium]
MESEKTQTLCPKCDRQNPHDARFCNVCGRRLIPRRQNAKRIDVKLSGAAVVSFACSLIALACFVPGLIAIIEPSVLHPRSDLVNNIACVSILAGGLGMLLAITAFVYISISGGRVTGRGFAAIGAVIPPVLIVVMFWHNIGRWYASTPRRMVCGTSLSGIGKAMLIYSNDYDGKLPLTGGVNANWAQRIPNWSAENRFRAFGISAEGQGGVGSISSCFYLLVKYADVKPISFICRGDSKVRAFEPGKYGAEDRSLIDLWDFGPEPSRHCSFSYHMPFGQYALTTSSEPGMAVAADRNPWIDSPFVGHRKDFSIFDPDGNREGLRAGNTIGHHGDGQNVLFLDSHVSFEKRSSCGIEGDNVYTFWDSDDIRRGMRPVPGSQPQDRLDSLLVHDPPIKNVK